MVSGLVAGAFALYKYLGSDQAMEPQYTQIQAGLTARGRGSKVPKALKPLPLSYHAQTAIHDQTAEIVHKVTSGNTYVMSINGDKCGSTLAVGENVMLLNAHFHAMYVDNEVEADVHFCPSASWGNDQHTCCFDVPADVFKQNPPTTEMMSKDTWLIDLGQNMRPHRNIVKNFIEEKKLESMRTNIPITTVFSSSQGDNVYKTVSSRGNMTNVRTPYGTYANALRYLYTTQSGDCGSVTYLNDHSDEGNILGVHAAGAGAGAATAVVSREWIRANWSPTQMCPQSGITKIKTSLEDEGVSYMNHMAIAVVEAPVRLSRKTKLRKSILYDCFAPDHVATRTPLS